MHNGKFFVVEMHSVKCLFGKDLRFFRRYAVMHFMHELCRGLVGGEMGDIRDANCQDFVGGFRDGGPRAKIDVNYTHVH